MIDTVWKVKEKNPDKGSKDWLTHVLAKNRGLITPQKLQEFLNPTLDQILAVELSQVETSVKRAINAIKGKEKIIVYSDYDADGICAAAILWETLYDLGADAMPYVPHRIKEGYGLSKPAISKLAKEGVKLIITVDHGVTATGQVEHASSLGLDVIITDHHVLPKLLPKPFAMFHTTSLCGAGVAWCFAWEIAKKLKPDYKEKLLEKLELAAIATIADLVPLTGGSRAIVKIGLEKLARTKRPGLKALIRASHVNGKVGTYEIGHILAPRINAMGRIEHGLDSLRLICAKNQNQADELAQLLSKTNTRRQDLTTKAITNAMSLVRDDHVVGVIASESWHEGIIGLVASRLVEAYKKPMVVISIGENFSKGSARSIPGFNIVEAIRASSEFLMDAGGHPMAAGFTIETRHIEAFSAKINQHSKSLITDELLTPLIEIECQLETSDINHHVLAQTELFEPYGVANPMPLFVTKNLLVEDVRTVGAANDHLKLQASGLSAIGFNMGRLSSDIRPGYLVDLVYTLAKDKYAGNGGLQLKLKDLRVKN
ncbi:MAG: single-stranded-DNA-specific exonuclease RecJ [Candidatus Curtissbacteria bacterium]|nr:single-stranded-DNA-specific exonuclease RecJ [Candidatus Curtissbacteria bacterium]